MAEALPIVDTIARALCCEGGPCAAGALAERYCMAPAHLPAAVAAATAILTAEPPSEAVWFVCAKPYETAIGYLQGRICRQCPRERIGARGRPIKPHPCYASAAGTIRASNAALLREIEGASVPPARDVEP